MAEGLPQPGELVGAYRVVRLLGKGGMGAVFLARHERSGAEVALKLVLASGDAEADEAFRARFQREVEATAKLDHPHVVRIHASGFRGPAPLPYAVLELIRGDDLAKTLASGPLAPARAFELMEKVARALHHAHERGILHRDLKPANVLLRDGVEPVVTDFGLARDESQERLTRSGEALGTPAYMAPEQAEGDVRGQDARTDVYGLGAILYECLAGVPPFAADSHVRLLKKVLLDDPVDPSRLVAGVSREAGIVALRCLAKDRAHRYATARDLAEELARLRAGEPVRARAVGRLEALGRRFRRRPATYLMAAAIPLLVVAGAVGFTIHALDQGARKASARARLEATSRAARATLQRVGYPVLAPSGALVPSVDLALARALVGQAALAREEAALRGAIDPESDHRARTCARWLALLDDPRAAAAPTNERAERSDEDQVLESAAALRRAFDSRNGGETAVLRQKITRDLPKGGDARVLVDLLELASGDARKSVTALERLVADVTVLEDSRAAWAPIVRREWVRLVRRACDGEDVGDLAGAASTPASPRSPGASPSPATSSSLASSLAVASSLVPGLRARLADEIARTPDRASALRRWVGSAPLTPARQIALVDLVIAIDPDRATRGRVASEPLCEAEDALGKTLDHEVATIVRGENSLATMKFTDSTTEALRSAKSLVRLDPAPIETMTALVDLLPFLLVGGKELLPGQLVSTGATLFAMGVFPTYESVPFGTDALGDAPESAARGAEGDAATLLSWKLAVLGAARENPRQVPRQSERRAALEAEAADRARDYVHGKTAFFEVVRAALDARTDAVGDRLRAIDALAEAEALGDGLLAGSKVGSEETARAAVAAADRACSLGHPLAFEAKHGAAECHASLAHVLAARKAMPEAREEMQLAATKAEEAWTLYTALDARARKLGDQEDDASRLELLLLNVAGIVGSTLADPGSRVKPLWTRAQALIALMGWADDEAARADFRRQAIATALEGLAVHERNHLWQWRLAGLLEDDGRLDEALVHALAAFPRPSEEGVKPASLVDFAECLDRLQNERVRVAIFGPETGTAARPK